MNDLTQANESQIDRLETIKHYFRELTESKASLRRDLNSFISNVQSSTPLPSPDMKKINSKKVTLTKGSYRTRFKKNLSVRSKYSSSDLKLRKKNILVSTDTNKPTITKFSKFRPAKKSKQLIQNIQ